MDEFASTVKKFQLEIKKIDEFISLYLKKDEIKSELEILSDRARDVNLLVENCNQIVKKDAEITEKHKETMSKMSALQLKMLNAMELMMQNKKEKCKPYDLLTPLKPLHNLGNMTPRMLLSDYKQSPFVTRTRPISLQFTDFETTITDDMFENIPKYIRGRETASELRTFLDEIIVPCFNEKYKLMYRKREALRNPQEIELWKLYRDQSAYFPGRKFITQGDISKKLEKMVDKKTSVKLQMLRHLGILQEQRKNTVVCYLWINKG